MSPQTTYWGHSEHLVGAIDELLDSGNSVVWNVATLSCQPDDLGDFVRVTHTGWPSHSSRGTRHGRHQVQGQRTRSSIKMCLRRSTDNITYSVLTSCADILGGCIEWWWSSRQSTSTLRISDTLLKGGVAQRPGEHIHHVWKSNDIADRGGDDSRCVEGALHCVCQVQEANLQKRKRKRSKVQYSIYAWARRRTVVLVIVTDSAGSRLTSHRPPPHS